MLSKKSLQVLSSFFSKNSTIQIPIGIIDEIVEIRDWVNRELKDENAKKED